MRIRVFKGFRSGNLVLDIWYWISGADHQVIDWCEATHNPQTRPGVSLQGTTG
jgi:hypothetical protein